MYRRVKWWECLIIMALIGIIFLAIWCGLHSKQSTYTIVIYQSYTNADNQTYRGLEPFAQVNMDKGSFFTFDRWTVTVK